MPTKAIAMRLLTPMLLGDTLLSTAGALGCVCALEQEPHLLAKVPVRCFGFGAQSLDLRDGEPDADLGRFRVGSFFLHNCHCRV